MADDEGGSRPGSGLPARSGRKWLRVGEVEPRVLGFPRSWFGPRNPLDARWARHPIRWVRWRNEVRRLGPYAADYEEPGHGGGAGRTGRGGPDAGRQGRAADRGPPDGCC